MTSIGLADCATLRNKGATLPPRRKYTTFQIRRRGIESTAGGIVGKLRYVRTSEQGINQRKFARLGILISSLDFSFLYVCILWIGMEGRIFPVWNGMEGTMEEEWNGRRQHNGARKDRTTE